MGGSVVIAPVAGTGLAVLDRAQRYVSKCPPAISGQDGHKTTFRVACVLVHGFALSADEALGVLRVWNRSCQPPWSEAELHHKVVSAVAKGSGKPHGYLLEGGRGESRAKAARRQPSAHRPVTSTSVAARPGKVIFVPGLLRRVAALTPNVDAAFVRDRSPLCPETQTPATFLQRLYRPGESLILFNALKSQGMLVCECVEPPCDARSLDHVVNGHRDGMWFLCNPVDGEYHSNPRLEGKRSRRSEESITAWRYMVLESDDANPQEWLALLVQMPLRIASICTSGGRSIHALVRVDAESKADWDAKAKELKPLLTMLGADPGAITAVRLTRLPGCYRGQDGPPASPKPPVWKRWVEEPLEFDEGGDPIWTPPVHPEELPTGLWTRGHLQELLYLNPEPDLTPIWNRITRREAHQKCLAGFRK